ncbi:voltage-gated hydrogen channel 1-like isoform X2 [Oratosquilla oratoria]|uniref:voltage-gated hydrogen channel 1-like isoform X2 n=1 Tax=Oratosquilla oratoria TaxID=337810 RepID=UPI003F778166
MDARLEESVDGSRDNVSLVSYSTEEESTLRPRRSVREIILYALQSTKCQTIIVVLVAIDTLLVIAELLLDLELPSTSYVPLILHAASLSLLCLFLVELALKVYALRCDFFTHKMEVFDGIVVLVAVCLDATYLHSHDAHSATGLIIILRLWRVVRIQNSMVMSVKRAGERKVAKERELRMSLEQELERYRQYCTQLEKEAEVMRDLMTQHSIPHHIPTKRPPPDLQRVNVVAES